MAMTKAYTRRQMVSTGNARELTERYPLRLQRPLCVGKLT
jgi:hypothetical protein